MICGSGSSRSPAAAACMGQQQQLDIELDEYMRNFEQAVALLARDSPNVIITEKDVETAVEACEGAEAALLRMERQMIELPSAFKSVQHVCLRRKEFEETRAQFTRVTQRWQRRLLLHNNKSLVDEVNQLRYSSGADHYRGITAESSDGAVSARAKPASFIDAKALLTHAAAAEVLGDSNQLASESEHVGMVTVEQLRTQRAAIISCHGYAEQTQEILADVHTVLKAMMRRHLLTKALLVAIIAVLLLAILGLLIKIMFKTLLRLRGVI